jgi:5-methylcytosine-specific restriction enzyme A
MKRCSGPLCKGNEKPESEFCLRKRSRDGLNAWCKECVRSDNKRRYDTDPAYRAKAKVHPLPSAVYSAKDLARHKRHYASDPGLRARIRRYQREYFKQRWENDPEFRRNRQQATDSRKRGLVGIYTYEEWMAKLDEFNWCCAYCGCDLTQLPTPEVTADHVVPVSKGGPNVIANIMPACRACNSSKGNR